MEVSNSTFTCISGGCNNGSGFTIEPYAAGEPIINMKVKNNSDISNWWAGIDFCSYQYCGRVQLDVDCTNFSNNTWNVVEDIGGSLIERCQ